MYYCIRLASSPLFTRNVTLSPNIYLKMIRPFKKRRLQDIIARSASSVRASDYSNAYYYTRAILIQVHCCLSFDVSCLLFAEKNRNILIA